jgi:hypothetical protein
MYPSLKSFLVAASLMAAGLLLNGCASPLADPGFPEPPISPVWHRS